MDITVVCGNANLGVTLSGYKRLEVELLDIDQDFITDEVIKSIDIDRLISVHPDVKSLEHHKATTCGLWATDRPLEDLLTDFWQSSSDACPLEESEASKQELAFRKFVKNLQFQIDF